MVQIQNDQKSRLPLEKPVFQIREKKPRKPTQPTSREKIEGRENKVTYYTPTSRAKIEGTVSAPVVEKSTTTQIMDYLKSFF